MNRRIIPLLALVLAVAFAFLAYLNPAHVLQWSSLMTLCR